MKLVVSPWLYMMYNWFLSNSLNLWMKTIQERDFVLNSYYLADPKLDLYESRNPVASFYLFCPRASLSCTRGRG